MGWHTSELREAFRGQGEVASLRVTKHPSVHLQLLKPLASLIVDLKHPEREGSVLLPLAATYSGVKIGQ